MKNLVMGLAKGYNWYILEPFVRSFIKNVPNADLVLFTDRFSPFTRDRFKKIGGGRIKLEPVPDYAQNARPNNIRWKIFAEYVKKHGAKYKQILTSDTRDVIFQSDVFKEFENQSNYLGYTTEGDNIKGEKCGNNSNYQWITESFGKAEADKLADKEIICDGTVIGTAKEMGIFFEKMVEYMPSFDKGHDQTVMQYLYYNNLLPFENIIKMDGNSGEIFTAAVYHLLNKPKIKDNVILRGDGGIPAVVHQHDRHPLLEALQDNLYREKKFNPDGRFLDVKSAFDQTILLIHANKLNVALVFFLSYVFGKTNFEKQGETLLKAWRKILMVNAPLTPDVELLEISLQRALIPAFLKTMKLDDLYNLYALIKQAQKTNRTVSSLIKEFAYQYFLGYAKNFVQINDFKNAETCLNYMLELGFKPNQDFYILQAKIYRKLKKKEEAVAAYQKAVDLE